MIGASVVLAVAVTVAALLVSCNASPLELKNEHLLESMTEGYDGPGFDAAFVRKVRQDESRSNLDNFGDGRKHANPLNVLPGFDAAFVRKVRQDESSVTRQQHPTPPPPRHRALPRIGRKHAIL